MRRRPAGSGTPATNAAVSGARSAAVRNTPPQVVSSTGSVGSAGQYDPVSRRSSTASSLLARPTPATSRVGPAAVGAELVGLFRAPGARFVLVQRGGVTQDRFHDLPLGLDGVLAGEQLAVALQGVAEQPLVGWPVLPRLVGSDQLDVLPHQPLPSDLDPYTECDPHVGAEPQAQVVGAASDQLPEDLQWRPTELHQDLGGGERQALAGADVEWHPSPAPGVDLELDRGVGFHGRVRRDTVLIPVATELTPDHAGRVQRPDGSQQARALVADGVQTMPSRGVHSEQGQDLEQVVLEYVADRACLLVEGAAALHAEVLGHGDLHRVHVAGVPQ